MVERVAYIIWPYAFTGSSEKGLAIKRENFSNKLLCSKIEFFSTIKVYMCIPFYIHSHKRNQLAKIGASTPISDKLTGRQEQMCYVK